VEVSAGCAHRAPSFVGVPFEAANVGEKRAARGAMNVTLVLKQNPKLRPCKVGFDGPLLD